MNKTKLYYIMLSLLLLLNVRCTKDTSPLGPPIDVLPRKNAFNLNFYYAVRTNMHLTFTGYNNLEGFYGNVMSPGYPDRVSCNNYSKQYLEWGFVGLESGNPSVPYNFWGMRVNRESAPFDFGDVQDVEDEILVLSFRVKASNGNGYTPPRGYVTVGGFTYEFPGHFPTSWSNVVVPAIISKEALARTNNGLQNVKYMGMGVSKRASFSGQTVNVCLDDLQIVVYKLK